MNISPYFSLKDSALDTGVDTETALLFGLFL